MNYEEMIKDTDKMIKEIMHREQIWLYVLIGLSVILTVLAVVMFLQEMKDRKVAKVAKVIGGNVYSPNVTDNVQIVNGVEFHQMGIPGRIPQ